MPSQQRIQPICAVKNLACLVVSSAVAAVFFAGVLLETAAKSIIAIGAGLALAMGAGLAVLATTAGMAVAIGITVLTVGTITAGMVGAAIVTIVVVNSIGIAILLTAGVFVACIL